MTEDPEKPSNLENKRFNQIPDEKMSNSIRFNQELYAHDSTRHRFFEKLKNIIITTASFSNLKPSFPKVSNLLTLKLFKNIYLENGSFERLLKKILRQIYYFSTKCQEIEQLYTRKLNSLNPQAIYSLLIEYLPIRIMFMSDEELEPIVEIMDEVNKKLKVQFDKLYGISEVFDKKIKPIDDDVRGVNFDMIRLFKLIITVSKRDKINVHAVQDTMDALDKKTANIYSVMTTKDVQNNIHQTIADSLDEAIKSVEEFIKELDGPLKITPETN